MPRPDGVAPLQEIDGLPPILRKLALVYLHAPSASSDHLLVLADALCEAAHQSEPTPLTAAARSLAAELARRAPEYAG